MMSETPDARQRNAQLEGPAASLDIGHIDVDDAVKLYQQYAGQAAFVDAAAPR